MLKRSVIYLFSVFLAAGVARANFSPIVPVLEYDLLTVSITESLEVLGAVETVHQDSQTFYSVVTNGQLTRWKRGTKTPVWQITLPSDKGFYSETLAVSRDGSIIAVGGSQGTIFLIDSENGRILDGEFKTHPTYQVPVKPLYTSMAFSNDGLMLAAGDANGLIHIWVVGRPDAVSVVGSVSTPVFDLKFSEDPRFLVSSNAKDVWIWNLDEQKVVVNLSDAVVTGFYKFEDAFLPPYERFIVLTTIKDTLLYDISAQKVIKQYRTNGAILSDSADQSKYGPLLTVANPALDTLYRFHKNPYVEELDFETGDVKKTFRQAPGRGLGAFGPYYTNIAPINAECGAYLVGTQSFAINIFRGAIENTISISELQLPCP